MNRKTRRAKKAAAEGDDRDYLEEALTEQQAADFLNLSVRFLQNRRTRGGGPAYVGVSGRCVRYRRRELIAWLDARTRANTSGSALRSQGQSPADPAAE